MNLAFPTSKEIAAAHEAIRRACEILGPAFGKTLAHTKKSKGIVTKFDVQVEEAMKKALHKTGIPILAEEGSPTLENTDECWIIDPIDGTTVFAHSNPNFAASLALVKRGRLCLGVVANPVCNEVFSFDGKKMTLNGASVGVGIASTVDTPIMFINSGYAVSDIKTIARVDERLAGKAYTLRLGSSALELAYVAAGRADVFMSIGDEVWDYAGGVALVQGAGGKVVDWKGRPFALHSKHIVAGNPRVVDELLPILRKYARSFPREGSS